MNGNRVSQSARRVRRAFTIVEIIVVVIIIGVLAAVVAPKVFGRVNQAKITAAQSGAAKIASQLQLYEADMGSIPETGDLTFLVTAPGDAPAGKYRGYLTNSDELKDPWGNPYVLVRPGNKNKTLFDVVSYGADGRPGGEGDNADIIKP